ncbi:DNA-processing protein DprA [Frateuria aurantia]
MTTPPDPRYWLLLLLRTPGLGTVAVRRQLQIHHHAEVAVRALRLSLDGEARQWLGSPDEALLQADLAWLAQPNHHLLIWGEPDYPPQLASLDDAPAALFVAGDPALLLYPQVAVVGARAASQAGRAHARRFAASLVERGFVVTSGLAEGIDGEAHVAALDHGGHSIAVMGTGPDRLYPAAHHALARRLVDAGAVVSELVPGTPARPWHFPQRNRLIAGLSLGTLVIEAGLQSGSLITARLAAEQGREVFAVPGSIDHALARGCHCLIREGARLVEDPQEVIDAVAGLAQAMGPTLAERLVQDIAGPPPLAAGESWRGDPEYVDLLDALGHDPTPLEDLVERTGQPVSALSSMLLMLELEGVVESLSGARYQRLED